MNRMLRARHHEGGLVNRIARSWVYRIGVIDNVLNGVHVSNRRAGSKSAHCRQLLLHKICANVMHVESQKQETKM